MGLRAQRMKKGREWSANSSWRIKDESTNVIRCGCPHVHSVLLRPEWCGARRRVTADTLYEAVAQGLRVFRENDWIDEVGRGQTTISVVVRHPEVQHKVRVQEFERWLESQGRTPAEVSLKGRLRELLGYQVAASGTTKNRDR